MRKHMRRQHTNLITWHCCCCHHFSFTCRMGHFPLNYCQPLAGCKSIFCFRIWAQAGWQTDRQADSTFFSFRSIVVPPFFISFTFQSQTEQNRRASITTDRQLPSLPTVKCFFQFADTFFVVVFERERQRKEIEAAAAEKMRCSFSFLSFYLFRLLMCLK